MFCIWSVVSCVGNMSAGSVEVPEHLSGSPFISALAVNLSRDTKSGLVGISKVTVNSTPPVVTRSVRGGVLGSSVKPIDRELYSHLSVDP